MIINKLKMITMPNSNMLHLMENSMRGLFCNCSGQLYRANSVVLQSYSQKIFLPKNLINSCIRYGYSNGTSQSDKHKYANKTTKEIQKEIALQKWRSLQNSFKSLSSHFNLNKPTPEQLQSTTDYPKPKAISFTLESLRQCSFQYPVYLYWELQKNNSSFSGVIDKVIENLWKAQKKELLEILEFLWAWQYKFVKVDKMYQVAVDKFQLSMSQLFSILKKFNPNTLITKPSSQQQPPKFQQHPPTQLQTQIELKTIQRLANNQLSSTQYGDLLKIVNYYTVRNIISQQFYTTVCNVVRENIQTIPPKEVLQAYIYFCYNFQGDKVIKREPSNNQSIQQKKKQELKQGQQGQQKQQYSNLTLQLLQTIQKRLLSKQCLSFLAGQQQVALLHTYLKTNLTLLSQQQSYNQNLEKIIKMIKQTYYAADFSYRDKINLLDLCGLLPPAERNVIIGIMQGQMWKREGKFDHRVLANLYVISHQNNILSPQMRKKLQELIIDKLFLIQKKDISRILWIATLTNSNKSNKDGRNRLNILMKKVQTIIEGGLNQFTIKDISIIVWSMCAAQYGEGSRFWGNIQAFLIEELQRGNLSASKTEEGKEARKDSNTNINQKQQQVTKAQKNSRKLVNDCCWILWAYHNNRQLHLQTIDLISNIIISQFSSKYGRNVSQKVNISIPQTKKSINKSQSQPQPQIKIQQQSLLTPFELTSILTFYNSINLPSQFSPILSQLYQICQNQFKKIYKTMQPIQICKCLKYIGYPESPLYIWKDKQIYNGILEIFQVQLEKIAYRDLMSIVAVLVGSGIKNKRIAELIKKVLERKKRLQSLEKFGTDELESDYSENKKKQDQKKSKWKFPI